ncbi:MAG: hypothetical protein QOI77_2991, partial [Blastocatellia bacterium]|nr:hypothetical protein [Blastocatellia bacterium]
MTSIRIRALLCITMVLAVGFAVAAQKPELVIQTGHSQTGSSNALEAILFNPDGKILATGSQDGTVNLWDAGTGLELRTIKTGWINTIAFSPNGKILACGGPEGLKLWDVVSGTVVRTIIPDHESNVYAVTFSPDGNIVASGSHTGRSKPTLKLWNVTSGMELQDFKGFSSTVTSLSFNPNGKTIASSGGDNSVKLWDVSTGTELRALRAHSNPVSSVVFSPDGKTLASGSKGDETIKLWDVATGSELRTLELKWFNRVAFAFSPDGKTLATGGSGKVKLWDVATGTDLRTVEAQRVNAIAFSPDGHTLASSNGSNTTLWNISTGTELRTLLAHSAEVKMVAFLPESDILVTSTADDAV